MIKKLIIPFTAIALFSCSSPAPEAAASATVNTDTVKKAEVTSPENELAEFEFTTLVINIPSPFEIIGKLPKAGLAFNAALTNPSENESKYASTGKKGLNYGVYVVDLVYISTNQQFEQVKPYFKTSRSLAKNLDCAESFDKIAGSRLEQNMDKPDTINKVIDQIYTEMDSYLRTNERILTSTQILIGSWVESQYITVSLIKDAEKNEKNNVLFEKVSQQKGTLDKLLELSAQFENDKEFKSTIKDIKEIQAIYAKDVKFNDIDKAALGKLYDKLGKIRANIIN
jgi:hypothetical protein